MYLLYYSIQTCSLLKNYSSSKFHALLSEIHNFRRCSCYTEIIQKLSCFCSTYAPAFDICKPMVHQEQNMCQWCCIFTSFFQENEGNTMRSKQYKPGVVSIKMLLSKLIWSFSCSIGLHSLLPIQFLEIQAFFLLNSLIIFLLPAFLSLNALKLIK